MATIRFSCPNCRQPFTVETDHAGKKGSCPVCGQRVEIPSSSIPPPTNRTVLGKIDDVVLLPNVELVPVSQPSPARRADPFDFDEPAEAPIVPSYRRRGESPGGLICSILSLLLGAIGVLFCPFVFCVAGIILGVIGMVLCRSKGLAILGFVVSFLGLIANIVFLLYLISRHEL